MAAVLEKPDQDVEVIRAALALYEQTHEGSDCLVSRYNPASIRVKIVDPAFDGRSKANGTTMQVNS